MRLLSSNVAKWLIGSCYEQNWKFIHGDSFVAETVEYKLGKWNRIFKEHFIEEPKVSAEYIVAHVLGKKTVSLYMC